MSAGGAHPERRYARIYAIVAQIPPGRVATYGQIAAIEGHSTARMVGYALAALPTGLDVPWHRVVNRAGTVSERRGGGGTDAQRALLEAEGVAFDGRGRLDRARHGWTGPDWPWLEANRCQPAPAPWADLAPAAWGRLRRARRTDTMDEDPGAGA